MNAQVRGETAMRAVVGRFDFAIALMLAPEFSTVHGPTAEEFGRLPEDA